MIFFFFRARTTHVSKWFSTYKKRIDKSDLLKLYCYIAVWEMGIAPDPTCFRVFHYDQVQINISDWLLFAVTWFRDETSLIVTVYFFYSAKNILISWHSEIINFSPRHCSVFTRLTFKITGTSVINFFFHKTTHNWHFFSLLIFCL